MDEKTFERIASEEFSLVPPRFAGRIQNLALLIEGEMGEEAREENGLAADETLLGLYRGIPATERGSDYGGVLPDTITLYREPLLEEAQHLLSEDRAEDYAGAVRLAVRETLWHEIGHHFGLSEEEIHAREEEGSNSFL